MRSIPRRYMWGALMPNLRKADHIISVTPLVVEGVIIGSVDKTGKTYYGQDALMGNTHFDPITKQFIDFISLAKGAEGKSPNKPWSMEQRAAYVWLLKLEYKGMGVAGMKAAIDGWTKLTYAEQLAEAGIPNYNILAAKAGVTPGFLKLLVEMSPEQMRKDLGDIAIAKALVESDKGLLLELKALVEAGGENLDPATYEALKTQLQAHSFPIRRKIIQLSEADQKALRERRAELLGVDPSQVDVETQKIVKEANGKEIPWLPVIGGAVLLWFLTRG